MFVDGSVVCNLKSREKFAAIHELLTKASVFRKIKDISLFEQAVVAREKKLSTGLGHGVAFAHGKTDTVDSLYVALGISKSGIDYEALDGNPVYLLFMVANPPDGHVEYLKLISAISRMIRNTEFRDRIVTMTDEKEIELEFRQALEKLEAYC
ncbi:MAG: PTS sugar transporter subunit IIA [Spirochaetales bacterium]|nr:PTS sugar transporter subunit IIA [Spirochaetales bacterium]